MPPLFGTFGLVPFFSVPPFGFCCCSPSIARTAKFLHTQQKQFRSAKTNCANQLTAAAAGAQAMVNILPGKEKTRNAKSK
jgi:hypothetical protein